MNEEIKLTWRKTTDTFTLMGWSGIKYKSELPYEYVNGKGPKFWSCCHHDDAGDIRYIKYIHLDNNAGKALDYNTFPSGLYIGIVLTYREQARVAKYILNASQRLHDINAQIADSEIITTIYKVTKHIDEYIEPCDEDYMYEY